MPRAFQPSLSSVIWSLMALAAPMVLGQAGQVVMQLTDTYMVGQVGAVPLAGASLAGNLVMFALYFGYGSLGALAPRVAQAFGGGDIAGASATARAGAWLGGGVGLLMALVLTAIVPWLGHLGQPAEVVAVTKNYLLLIAWSLPAAMLAVALGQMAESINRPWPVVGIMVGSIVLNAGLNVILIFGHWGFPALGLEGAGWATLIARVVQVIALLAWVRVDVALTVFRSGPACLKKLRSLWKQGLPVAGQDVLEGGSFAVGAIMLGWLGTTALAANQVTMGIASLAWMFPMALATAASVRVAQAAGAGDLAGARRVGLLAVGFGVALMAACALVYTTCGPWLASLFTKDVGVAKLAGLLVTIAGIYQISDAIQSVSLGALRGLLDNRVPLIANAICYWILSLPTIYLLAFVWDWGAVGVWVGYLPWMVLTGLFFLLRFVQRTRVTF
ncbi:MAG: MATE family efflux transporter [Terrimicrobiaceae bacterium]